jgi:hypothetical protein
MFVEHQSTSEAKIHRSCILHKSSIANFSSTENTGGMVIIPSDVMQALHTMNHQDKLFYKIIQRFKPGIINGVVNIVPLLFGNNDLR